MALPAAFGRYRAALDAALREVVGEGSPPLLYRMMRYHLGWEDAAGQPLPNGGGKALRPTLCLLACQAVGGDWRRALPAATAVELVHNFSLIHDDIQDQDWERRHRPTVWALWGQSQAINAGDSMMALARLAHLRQAEVGVPAPRVVQAARILDEAALEMIQGQCLDLSFEESLEVDLDAYWEMIAKKTGALFGCALSLGALVGSDSAPVVEAFRRCGRLLGVAFQVRDDMLGIWGAELGTGKPVGADIRRKKKSLPIVYALAQAPPAIREELLAIYSRPTLDDEGLTRVVGLLEEVGAAEYCRRIAMAKKEEALAQLDPSRLLGSAYGELREVAEFVLEREY